MTTPDITVLALKPEQMRPAQEALITWAGERLRALNNDLAEQERNRDAAAATPFPAQLAGWRAQVAKTKRVITFYEKVKDALDAGYIIVPDFPIDAFAIRVAEDDEPDARTTEYATYRRPDFTMSAKELPSGEGKYVSPRPDAEFRAFKDTDSKGQSRDMREWWATEFREVGIPARLVRPEILNATNKALTLKIFDEIGLVGQPKRDPIIVGRIIDPRDKYRQKRVTFFIAWWLDTTAI